MSLIAPRISSALFSFCVRDKMFSAEASELGPRYSGRVYNDAYDDGFIMENPKTGGRVLFIRSGGKHDQEGDLLWESFIGYDLRGRPLSGRMSGLECRVYND